MNNRHKQILSIMSDGKKVTVNDLADQLSVSQATIRQDLTMLENKDFSEGFTAVPYWMNPTISPTGWVSTMS